jgi:hypothetical protein
MNVAALANRDRDTFGGAQSGPAPSDGRAERANVRDVDPKRFDAAKLIHAPIEQFLLGLDLLL